MTAPALPPGLMTVPPEDDPRVAGWLVPGFNCTDLGYEIVLRCFCDVGICEQPESSNRGKRIDHMAERLGLPVGLYWCAIWQCCVLADRGCLFPVDGANCDEWIRFTTPATLRELVGSSDEARKHLIGSQILYGTRGRGDHRRNAAALRADGWDAVHIGTITRVTGTRLYTCEGNRGYAGGVTNNGEWVSNDVCRRADIIGVVAPMPAPNYVPRKHTIRQEAA